VFVVTAMYHLRDQFYFRKMFAGVLPDLGRYGHFFFFTSILTLAGTGTFHLGIVLSGWLTGNPDIVAHYSVILYSLQPLNLLPTAMVTVLLPTISRHHGAGQTRVGVEIAERAFPPLFLVMTLICGTGAILGWEAIRVISGTTTGEMIIAFEVILFSMYLLMVTAPPSILLNATDYIALIAYGGATSAAVAIAVWFGVLPGYGLLGAVAGYWAYHVGKGLWALVAARRIFQWRARLGWSALLTAPIIIVLAAVSLASAATLHHVMIAVLFVGFFLAFHVRTLNEYVRQLVAELRSTARKR
jgi:O-antigen/teichoic acid export membrane protein